MKVDDLEERSKRKRVAAIISRWAGATSIPFASQSHGHDHQKSSDHIKPHVSDSKNLTAAVNSSARQSASILSAMAASAKNATDATAERLSIDPKNDDDERFPFESPLRARRRLAAIATQLGLATSTATQSSHRRSLSLSSATSEPESDAGADARWSNLPRYKDLPTEGGYPGCAWAVWGKGDQLGTINLLTDAVVARAAREEVRTGARITLNWPLHLPLEPFFKRKEVRHQLHGKGGEFWTKRRDATIEALRKQGMDVVNRGQDSVPVCDDTLDLNTQSGSQWDGLRHYGHLGLDCFYGGVSRKELQDSFQDHSAHPITPEELASEENSKRDQLGIHHLAQRGICGRGVLLDVFGYLSSKPGGPRWKEYAYDPSTTYVITVADLKATAKAQGVTFRQGDILLVRSGFTFRYYNSTAEERQAWTQRLTFTGVDQSEEMKAFLWDNHFAAVAGDAPAFECRPGLPNHPLLHETLLAMWGMPIGELFDLEPLVNHAAKTNRWTFFFSSWPLNVQGGVASTANAAAVF
ncbi:hypothetical protein ACQY0O_006866 [Thecaphora frezii]